jgi:hypothetical protein
MNVSRMKWDQQLYVRLGKRYSSAAAMLFGSIGGFSYLLADTWTTWIALVVGIAAAALLLRIALTLFRPPPIWVCVAMTFLTFAFANGCNSAAFGDATALLIRDLSFGACIFGLLVLASLSVSAPRRT